MSQPEVTSGDAGTRRVSRRVVVPAPAGPIFDLVADPHRHAELDGSGTVRDSSVSGPDRLSSDAKFTVPMKQFGVPYRITSRVIEVIDGKVVEWQHPLGHRWRWEFDPASEHSTRVTETFDYSRISGSKAKLLELFGVPKQNATGIESTLRKLQQRFSA